MPKLTLDNSFRFHDQEETTSSYFHSASTETLLQKLTSDWLGQFAGEVQIQADLIGWRKMLVKINEVLDDALVKQMTNQYVRAWLGELQNLACDVEYLFDEFKTEAFRKMLSRDDDESRSKVKEVSTRLEDIASQVELLELKEVSGSGKCMNVRKILATKSLVSKAKVYGRVKVKELHERGTGTDTGSVIFTRPLIKSAKDLDFLLKEDALASLEKIGEGGCGEVYKAELPGSNGKMIAVKKIRTFPTMLSERRQIKNEIKTAGRIWHKNLHPLQAHITGPDYDFLVYEFMKNGSLQDILNNISKGRRELDWLARHRIARGIASGLEYLHMYHRPSIIHCDLKPANVLIDDDMEARISDFGLAKTIPDGHTQIRTSYVAGTVAYMAPECYLAPTFSEKCDIYSFGVLLGVLVIGKLPSNEFFHCTMGMSFVEWMRNGLASENPERIIDSKLLGNGYQEQLLLALKIAYFCTMDDPEDRPSSKGCQVHVVSDTALIYLFTWGKSSCIGSKVSNSFESLVKLRLAVEDAISLRAATTSSALI